MKVVTYAVAMTGYCSIKLVSSDEQLEFIKFVNSLGYISTIQPTGLIFLI